MSTQPPKTLGDDPLPLPPLWYVAHWDVDHKEIWVRTGPQYWWHRTICFTPGACPYEVVAAGVDLKTVRDIARELFPDVPVVRVGV